MSSSAAILTKHDGYPRRLVSPAPRQDEKTGENAAGTNFARFKASHTLKGLIFLWFCIIHIIGIFYFMRGFLLTKLILEDRSSCEHVPLEKWSGLRMAPSDEGCWYPKKFNKAVIIIIDALRYDFTVPFASLESPQGPHQYHDAFPILYDQASTRPENAFLLPFLADPPTTTLQRLKALTTGTLPTLLDAGSNFAGTAVEEDNLLVQMRSQGKTLVHLGDDTWQALFPGYFDGNLSHAYDSFNVWDLHTVDDGVMAHLMPLLRCPEPPWDFIFGHFLGVDHAGHRYGPDHPAMKDKLRQMNDAISKVIELLDDETLLVVMGDHGMDTKGDHGGESDDEVEAALWMYSTRPVFGRTHEDFVTPPASAKVRPVRQTDLVSTLSLLLGLPIPFNNIGAPIDEAFSEPSGPNWSALASVNDIALSQIRRYQDKYSQARKLDPDDPDQRQPDQSAIPSMKTRNPTSPKDEGYFKEAYRALRHHEHLVLTLYRQLWANFDLGRMFMGIIVLTGGVLCLLAVPPLIPVLDLRKMARSASVGAAIGCSVSLIVDLFLTQRLRPTNALFWSILTSSLAAFCSVALDSSKIVVVLPTNMWSWLTVFFTVSQAAGFASNSYTIHEDSILLFFLSTFGFVCCASSLRQREASDRYLGVAHSVLFVLLSRVASFSRLCREEQMPACRSSFYASSNSSTSAPWQIFLPFPIVALLPAFIKARYAGTSSYVGAAPFWLGFCFRIGLLLTGTYWMLDAADNGRWLQDSISAETLKQASLTLSRCVLGIAIVVGTVTTIWSKPCIDITTAQQKPGEGQAGDAEPRAKPTITILGYANLHGTRYFLLLPAVLLLVSLLLPPMGQFSIAICMCQILCLLEMLDANGLTTSFSSPSPHQVTARTSVGPVVLALLGSYHFFKTGHQATLASIQWNAAFVPFRTIVYPWSPLLIVLNTFGPQILCALAVPLTVLWKRPVDRTREEDSTDAGGKEEPRSKWGEDLMRGVMQALLAHMSYYASIQLATTLWAGHLRRHLMLYRVFMPRFLMASVLLVVIDLMILLGSWSMLRIEALSVGEILL